MRDNATAVAQQAISEAHAALAPKPTSADVAEDDIASPADEAIAQAALAKTPSAQTVSLTPSRAKAGPAYVYPNPTLTPGAILTTDTSTICTPGYASSVRNVSTATKKQVYAEYRVSYPQPTGALNETRLGVARWMGTGLGLAWPGLVRRRMGLAPRLGLARWPRIWIWIPRLGLQKLGLWRLWWLRLWRLRRLVN